MDNTINSLVSQAVGVTDQQIRDYLTNNPGMSDSQIVQAMQTYGVSPSQMASAVGMPEGQVISRIAATVAPGQTVTLGNTVVQPQYETVGQGQDQQVGGLQNVITYKTDENKVGGGYNQYSATGELERTGTQQKVDTSLGGAVKDIVSNPGFKIAALAYGGNALSNALGGASAIPGAAGTTFAGEALADAGLLSGGGGTALGSLAATTPFAGEALTDAGLLSGGGSLTPGALTAGGVGGTVAGMGTGTGITTAGAGGLGGATGAGGLGGSLGSGLGALTPGGLAAGNTLLGGAALGTTLASLGAGAGGSLLGSTLGNTLGNTVGSALGTTLGQGLGLSALGSGLGAAANQAGISDARNLINQYGGIANTQLGTAYQNAQNLNAANRQDLGNIYANTTGNMQNLYNQQVGYQNPYQDIGQAGSQGLLANQDYLTHQFNANDLNANLAPNYAFQLQQGQMANQRAGNMGGGALGGNALKGLQDYTQNYAGGAYQNAFNNYNTQRNNIFSSLKGMADIGTTSAGQLAGLGNTYGSNMGSLASNYGGNLTTGAGQGINAANQYGLNTAGLATGLGSALASNATQSGANTSGLLSNLGNTALLGSMLKAT